MQPSSDSDVAGQPSLGSRATKGYRSDRILDTGPDSGRYHIDSLNELRSPISMKIRFPLLARFARSGEGKGEVAFSGQPRKELTDED
jgi:hypothetical protein